MERKIKKNLQYIPQALKHIFFRKHLVEYDFFSGTTSWRDCISILWSIFKREPLQDGPYISAYEKMVAEYHGVRYAFSFAAGRMALYSILEALDLGKGDEVILPAYSCVVCPNAILYRGAIPIYVDIEPTTFNLDPKKIEAKITPRTKAIMAQHTFGLPCDLDEVIEIAQRHGIAVIEDCAHAVGAEYKGKKVGSIAHVGFYSTDHTKMLSTSTGGVVTTDDEELASRIRQIYSRTPFLPKSMIRKILFTFVTENFLHHPKFYFIGKWFAMFCGYVNLFHFFYDEGKIEKPTEYPYPARLSNIQAKIGIRQMQELEQNIAHRREIARQYDGIFKLHPQQFDGSHVDRKHVFLRYSFLISDYNVFKQKFSKYMYLGDWFNTIAIGRKEDFYEIYYQEGECPVGETVAYHSANFPTHNKIRNPALILKFAKDIIESKALILPANLIKEKGKV